MGAWFVTKWPLHLSLLKIIWSRTVVVSGKFCSHFMLNLSPYCRLSKQNKIQFPKNERRFIQSDSVARGPKILSIKNYVIEIITWKFIYTYRERCKTGPAHNRCWNWSPFTSKHTWMPFSKFWNTFPKVSALTAWVSWHIASLSFSIVRVVFFCTLCPSIGPKERSRQALDREIWVDKVFFF